MRIFLTGASGFIGSVVCSVLIKRGCVVTALSREKQKMSPEITWCQGDITSSKDFADAIKGCRVVIHLAGKTHEVTSNIADRKELFKVNSEASIVFAQLAARAGVKHFIHVSSTGVFGPGEGEYNEDSLCQPVNAYEQSKLEGESGVLAEATDAMHVTVVRPSNVFGENHPSNKLLTWFRTIRDGRVVLIRPTDQYWVNYIYVGDVAGIIATIATEEMVNANLINNSAIYIVNNPITVNEFFKATAKAVGVPANAVMVPKLPLAAIGFVLDKVSSISSLKFPLTINKVMELSNKQVFSANRFNSLQSKYPYRGVPVGLAKTCAYYREKGLL